jgi:hypothetical protein
MGKDDGFSGKIRIDPEYSSGENDTIRQPIEK